jgi:hypothetical protein
LTAASGNCSAGYLCAGGARNQFGLSLLNNGSHIRLFWH